jgi:hypothetical protein
MSKVERRGGSPQDTQQALEGVFGAVKSIDDEAPF